MGSCSKYVRNCWLNSKAGIFWVYIRHVLSDWLLNVVDCRKVRKTRWILGRPQYQRSSSVLKYLIVKHMSINVPCKYAELY